MVIFPATKLGLDYLVIKVRPSRERKVPDEDYPLVYRRKSVHGFWRVDNDSTQATIAKVTC